MCCSLLWRFWHWQCTGLWNHRLTSAPALLPMSRQGLPAFGWGLKVCNCWENTIIDQVISRESAQPLEIRYEEYSCWNKLCCHKTRWWCWSWTTRGGRCQEICVLWKLSLLKSPPLSSVNPPSFYIDISFYIYISCNFMCGSSNRIWFATL